MPARWWELGLAAALVAAAAALALAATSSGEGAGTPEQRAHAVAATLKCPVCHDLSAADSPAPVAQQMRARILDEVRAGRTPDQIRAEFVASYGEWILLDPPRRGLDLLPWLGPALLGLAGLAVTADAIRRWSGRRGPGHGEDEGEDEGGVPLDDGGRRLLERAMDRLGGEVE